MALKSAIERRSLIYIFDENGSHAVLEGTKEKTQCRLYSPYRQGTGQRRMFPAELELRATKWPHSQERASGAPSSRKRPRLSQGPTTYRAKWSGRRRPSMGLSIINAIVANAT
jgi:hypothetical protein